MVVAGARDPALREDMEVGMEAQAGACSGGPARSRRILAALVAASLMTMGCQGMADTRQGPTTADGERIDNTVADWPLTFVQHDFGAYCYSTYGCRVLYNGFDHTGDPEDVLQLSSASLGDRYPGNFYAGYIGVMNFPEPAQVTWRSADGVRHEASVDIGEIFHDQLILHDVPRENIREGVSILSPEIILEVNDRTINIYMRGRIPTKSLRTPGNPYSDFRNDLVLAWSRTY